MTNNLSGEFLNNYDTDTPIEELWSEFKDICKKCLNQVPIKLSNKRPQQPWITARIKRLSNRKQQLYNKAMAALMISVYTKNLRRLYKKSVEMPIIIILLTP